MPRLLSLALARCANVLSQVGWQVHSVAIVVHDRRFTANRPEAACVAAQAGHEVILQCESDPGAQQVLSENFPGVALVPDVRFLTALPQARPPLAPAARRPARDPVLRRPSPPGRREA